MLNHAPGTGTASNLWQAAGSALGTPAGGRPIAATETLGPVLPAFSQERIAVLCENEPNPEVFNVPLAWWVDGRLEEEILRETWRRLTLANDAFRSRLCLQDGTTQLVTEPYAEISIRRTLAGSLDSAKEIAIDEVRRPLNLNRAPLVRTLLVRLPGDRQLFVVTMHQAIMDGASQRLLAREFGATYSALSNGTPVPQWKKPRLIEHAQWQRDIWRDEAPWEASLSAWRDLLNGPFDLMQLPYRAGLMRVETGPATRIPFLLAADVAAGIQAISRRAAVSPFVTLLASLGILFERYTEQENVMVFVTSAGRVRPELRNFIGLAANILPFRLDLGNAPTVGQLLARVHEYSMLAYAHQSVPFERLIGMLRPRSHGNGPRTLIQVQFLFNNSPIPPLSLPGARLTPAPEIDPGLQKPDFLIEVAEHAGTIEGAWKVRADQFPDGLAGAMCANWLALLSELAGR